LSNGDLRCHCWVQTYGADFEEVMPMVATKCDKFAVTLSASWRVFERFAMLTSL